MASPYATSVRMRAKKMLAVGTGFLRGEDTASRGRLLLLEASRQDGYTGASGVAFAAFQLQLIAEKEVKGQVTALAPLEGHVLAAVGPRLEVYKLVGDDIVCCSFFSAQLLTSSVATVKQYILAADAFKSTTLLYWRDRNKSLNFLAQDLQPAHAYAADFVVSGGGLGLLLADGGGNLQLLGYANAAVPESRGGTRLLSHGALHLGARVNRFTRVALLGGRHAARILAVLLLRSTGRAPRSPWVCFPLDGACVYLGNHRRCSSNGARRRVVRSERAAAVPPRGL